MELWVWLLVVGVGAGLGGWLYRVRVQALSSQIQALQNERVDLIKSVTEWQTKYQSLEQRLLAEKENLNQLIEKMRLEYSLSAQQLIDAKLKTLEESNQKNISQIMDPLREQLYRFEKTIEEKYTNELKERYSLKNEIERLIQANDRMMMEANSLTRALRGDNKTQGDWGELVLARILEESGLREGFEYVLQKQHVNHEGDLFRPDVIIYLPEDKHIVVDSKVSLKAYESYRNEELNDRDRQQFLSEHIRSLERHIEELSQKHYAFLKGVRSPEFVFLFVPIESAYVLAMQTKPELSSLAWRKGIALVTATTLMTSLKTVASIWRLEKQNRNALEIAQEGAKLYDKFVLFYEEFEKLGKTLETGQRQYLEALNRLKDGQGNVFRRIEKLKELGVSPTKQIKRELTD